MSFASGVAESSPPAPPLTPQTPRAPRNWSESLLNWVKCILGSDKFHSLSHRALFALIKCFDEIKDDADDDDSYLERSIVLFLKREYPYFRRGKHVDVSEDTTLIASLLLHYSCVKSKDVAIRGTMCQQLDTVDQNAILIFANNLMKHENITERNLQNAIAAISTDGEHSELSYNEKVSSPSLQMKRNVVNSPLIKSPLIVGTPSSLRFRKVFHLEAELGAERFDRNFLQEEVDRQSQRIVELEKLQDTYREEVRRLRRELNLVGDFDDNDKVENCNQCKRKEKMLDEELRSHELEILRLLSNIQNVEEERDSLISRLTESEHAVSLWSSQAVESENIQDGLKTQLETAQSEMCNLKVALLDANRCLEEYHRENHLNNSVECDDDTLPLKKSTSSSLIASAEDLGKAVIDVQLKEQIKRNCVLNDKLEVISKDKKDVEEVLQKTREENEELLSKVQTYMVFENKFEESQKRLHDEINTVEELKEGFLNLRNECQSKSDLIEVITNEKNNLNNIIESNKTTIENLNKEVEMKCSEILTLVSKLGDVETKNSSLTEENSEAFDRLANAHNNIKSLNNEISSCKVIITDYEAELEDKKSELCKSEEKLDALKRECQELQNSVNSYISQQEQSENDNFALKTTINTMLKEYMTTCIVNDEKFCDYEREISSKNGQLDELLLKCCQLEKNLSDCSIQCENLDQDLQRKNCRLDVFSQTNITLECKLEECEAMLTMKISEILKLTEENIMLENDKKALVEKYDILTNDYNMRNDFIDNVVKEKNSLHEDYTIAVESLNKEISSKNDLIIEFKNKNAEFESKYSKLVDENSGLSEKLITAFNEEKVLTDKLSSCEAVILDFEVKIKNVKSELSDKNDELNSVNHECLRTRNMIISYEEQMSVKSKELEELLLNSRQLKKQLSDCQLECESLNNDLKKANCDLNTLSHTNGEVQSRLKKCEEVLNEKMEEVNILTKENVSVKKDNSICIEKYKVIINDITKEKDDLEYSVKNYEAIIEELKKEICSKDSLVVDFTDKLKNVECKHSEAVEENKGLLEKLQKTFDEVSENEFAIDCFEKQVENLSAESIVVNEKLKECEERLILKDDEISKLVNEIVTYKNDNNALIEKFEALNDDHKMKNDLLEEVKKEKNNIQDEIDNYKIMVDKLSTEISTKVDSVNELTEKLTRAESKYLEDILENNEILSLSKTALQDCEEQIKNIKLELFERNTELDIVKQDCMELEKNITSYKEQVLLKDMELEKLSSNSHQVEKQFSESQLKYENLNKDLKKKSQIIFTLETKLEEFNEILIVDDILKPCENSDGSFLVEKAAKLIDDYKMKNDTIKEIVQEKNDLNHKIENYEVVVNDLNKEICTKCDLIVEVNNKLMEYESKYSELVIENKKLSEKLVNVSNGVATLSEEICLSKTAEQDFKIQIKNIESELVDKSLELEATRLTVISYEEQMSLKSKELEETLSNCLLLKKQLLGCQLECENLNKNLQEISCNMDVLTRAKVDLESKLNVSEQILTLKMEEILKLSEEKISVKNDNNIIVDKYDTLINEVKKEKNDLQNDIGSQKVVIEELNKEMRSKSICIAELNDRFKNFENKHSEALKENDILTEKLTDACNNMKTLKEESELSQIVLQDRENQVISLKSELRDRHNELEIVKQDCSQLQNTVVSCEEQISAKSKELEESLMDSEKLQSLIKESNCNSSVLLQTNIALENKLKECEKSLTLKIDEISKLTEEKVSYKNNDSIIIEKYETIINNIKKEKNELQDNIESCKIELNKNICSKNELVTELTVKLKNIECKYSEITNENNNLSEQFATKLNELSENKTAMNNFEIKIQELSTEISSLKNKFKQYEESLALKTEEILKLTSKKVSSKTDNNILIEKYEIIINDIKREKEDVQSTIESYKMTIEEMKKEISIKSELIAELVEEKSKSKIVKRDAQNEKLIENVFVQKKITADANLCKETTEKLDKLSVSIDDNISFEVFESESSLRQLDNVSDSNDDTDRISALIHSTEMIAKTCAQNVLEKDELILSLEKKCNALSHQVEDLQKINRDSVVTSITSDGDVFNVVRRSLSKTLERCSRVISDADSTTETDLNTYLSNVDSTMITLIDECEDLKSKLGQCEYDKEVEVKQKLSEFILNIKEDFSKFESELGNVSELRATLRNEQQRVNQILNGIYDKMFTSFQDETSLKKLDLCEQKLKRRLILIENEIAELDKQASTTSVTQWLYRRLDLNKLDFDNKIYSLIPIVDSVDRLKNDVDTLAKECEEYLPVKCKSEALYDRLHGITEKYSKLEEKSVQFELLNERLKIDNDSLTRTNIELTDKLSALRGLFSEVEVKNEQLTAAKVAQDENNAELRTKVETLTEKLNDINLKMYTENVKPLIDFDKMLQDNIKLRDELRSADLVRAEYASLKSAYSQIVDENRKLKQSAERNSTNELVADLRNEYEDKLNRMKQKMKQLYQEQISVYIDKQKEELARSESLCKKYTEKIKSYESHVNQLSSELWKVGEKLLMERNEKDWLKQRLKEYGSRQSLLFPSTSDITKNQMTKSSSVLKVFDDSVRDLIDERNWQSSIKKPNKAESGGLHMSDEEGEVFDNTYLTDLKNGVCESRHPKIVTNERNPAFDPDRLSELQWRNSMCLPHLKSSYPLELNLRKIKENEIKMGVMSLDDSIVVDKSSRPKKEAGQTSYKKPGPPTPSKKGGRQSLQGNDLREPLREHNDNVSKKSNTPSRIWSMVMGNNSQKQAAKDENTFGTPKGRRINLFKKPR